MVVKLEDLSAHGVGDEDCAGGEGDVRAGPEPGLHRGVESAGVGGDDVSVVGVVHTDFAVAHDDDESLLGGIVGDLDGPEIAGDGDDLLHDAFLGLDDVESHLGAEGVEVAGAGAAPDGGQTEVLGGAVGSGDEIVGELAVVGLHDQCSAGAAEDGHVAVAGTAKKVGAFICGVIHHCAGEIPNVGTDGPPVFHGVGGVVGMGG